MQKLTLRIQEAAYEEEEARQGILKKAEAMKTLLKERREKITSDAEKEILSNNVLSTEVFEALAQSNETCHRREVNVHPSSAAGNEGNQLTERLI